MDIRRVAVVGTGMMGPGIAATFALGGFETVLVSRTTKGAADGLAAARALADTLLVNGLAENGQVAQAKERLTPSTDLEGAARSAQMLVESIKEDLQLKQELFTRLDSAAPETILCSNTSGLSITRITRTPKPSSPPRPSPTRPGAATSRCSKAMSQDRFEFRMAAASIHVARIEKKSASTSPRDWWRSNRGVPWTATSPFD